MWSCKGWADIMAFSSQEESCLFICQHSTYVTGISEGNKVTFWRAGNSMKDFNFAGVIVLASKEKSFADFCVCTCCYWCSLWVAESS